MSRLRTAKERANYIVSRHATSTFSTTNGGIVEASGETEEFKGEPYYVSYRRSKTINMGNYESEKVEIGLTVPCKKTEQAKTLKNIIKWVNEEVMKVIQSIKEV
ncbi:MAG: hypothetical protein ACUVUQ_07510 [Thermodesulfovibrionales bacterium]